MKKRVPALLLSLCLCISLLPATLAAQEETYLISITAADGVVTSGYRDNWRWVALSLADPGRPGILLRGEDPNVEGSLTRSDGLAPGEALDAWGKAQHGKPATLTLGRESWECTAQYKDYGSHSVLYVDWPQKEDGSWPDRPDFDTIHLFRYDWEQKAADKHADALNSLIRAEGYTLDRQLDASYFTIVLRHREVPAQKGVPAYRDYELYLVSKRAYGEQSPLQRLLLPSTAVVGGGAPTDRAPDFMVLSEDGWTLSYTYSFDSPLSNGDTLCHEAGKYTYTVDLTNGELSVSHSEGKPSLPQQWDGFSDVPAGSWFEAGAETCARQGIMIGTGPDTFSPDAQLTAAKCLTLAVRLYDLQRGGDGAMKKAPEDWGKYTLTLADSTTWTRYGEQNSFFSYDHFDPYQDGQGVRAVTVLAPGDTPEERMAWARAHEGPATFTAEGRSYSGAVAAESGGYYGPQLRFACEEEPNAGGLLSNSKPGPDRWYRDAVYTVEQLGLREAAGFSSLLGSISYDHPDTARTNRENFAKALAVAAGELEKQYDVPSIPDLPKRNEQNAGIYALYEAGILNGLDHIGTFWGDKGLTRVEAAVMVARVLDPSQRLTAPPAVPSGYELAVAQLRTSFGYYNEETIETDYCTIFIYDRGGMMNAPSGAMELIYKPGSQLGDGTVIGLPHAWVGPGLAVCRPADTMGLSEDGKTFTYTYFREQDLGEPVQKAGVITYTVDLPTGEITEVHTPHSYDTSMAHVTRKRIISSDQHSEDREVVETLNAELCTAVLTKGRFVDKYDDYILSLVYKPGSALGDGAIKQLILPSTVFDAGYPWHHPTDRAPDGLAISEDGKTLTYSYSFDEALGSLHDAGTYLYTVDLATGELTVERRSPEYLAALADILQTQGFTVTQQLETRSATLLSGQVGGLPHGASPYLYLIQKADSKVTSLPLPPAPTTKKSHRLPPRQAVRSSSLFTLRSPL